MDAAFRDAGGAPVKGVFAGSLERQLLRDRGPQEPLTVWRGTWILVDGYRRADICRKHDLRFPVRLMKFANRYEALIWRCENMLTRRPMTAAQIATVVVNLHNHYRKHFGVKREIECYQLLQERLAASPWTSRRMATVGRLVHKLDRQIRVPLLIGDCDTDLLTLNELVRKHPREIRQIIQQHKEGLGTVKELLVSQNTKARNTTSKTKEANLLLGLRKRLDSLVAKLDEFGQLVPVDNELSLVGKFCDHILDMYRVLSEAYDWLLRHELTVSPEKLTLQPLEQIIHQQRKRIEDLRNERDKRAAEVRSIGKDTTEPGDAVPAQNGPDAG